jgi:putative transposase
LEAENAELKRLLADAMLNNTALKDLLGKMVTPVARSPGYRSSQEDILSQPAACPL